MSEFSSKVLCFIIKCNSHARHVSQIWDSIVFFPLLHVSQISDFVGFFSLLHVSQNSDLVGFFFPRPTRFSNLGLSCFFSLLHVSQISDFVGFFFHSGTFLKIRTPLFFFSLRHGMIAFAIDAVGSSYALMLISMLLAATTTYSLGSSAFVLAMSKFMAFETAHWKRDVRPHWYRKVTSSQDCRRLRTIKSQDDLYFLESSRLPFAHGCVGRK